MTWSLFSHSICSRPPTWSEFSHPTMSSNNSRASVKHPPSSLLTSDISVLALLNSRASLIFDQDTIFLKEPHPFKFKQRLSPSNAPYILLCLTTHLLNDYEQTEFCLKTLLFCCFNLSSFSYLLVIFCSKNLQFFLIFNPWNFIF